MQYISYLYFQAEPAEGQTPSPVFACFSPRQQKSMRRFTVKTHWILHHFHCNTGAPPIVIGGNHKGSHVRKATCRWVTGVRSPQSFGVTWAPTYTVTGRVDIAAHCVDSLLPTRSSASLSRFSASQKGGPTFHHKNWMINRDPCNGLIPT